MNPMTNVKNIQKLNKLELERGVSSKTSWHNQYRDSAWVFIGGLPYDLSEGDILAVFSQYGEIVNVNLVRDKATGKSKGFCFLCYEDQRSTILAVDNLNSIKILGRTLRVDHCESYRKPKETGEEDDLTQQLRAHGCAPKTPSASESEGEDVIPVKKVKKEKKEKKKSKKKREKVKSTNEHEDSDNNRRDSSQPIRVKQEKIDPGYEKYDTNQNRSRGPSTDSLKIKTEPMPRNIERDSEKVRDREFRTNRNTEVDRKRNKEDEFRYSRSNASSRSRSETSTRSHNADQQNSNGDRRTERREDYRTRERDVKRESDKDRSRDQGRPRHRDHSHEPYSHGRHK